MYNQSKIRIHAAQFFFLTKQKKERRQTPKFPQPPRSILQKFQMLSFSFGRHAILIENKWVSIGHQARKIIRLQRLREPGICLFYFLFCNYTLTSISRHTLADHRNKCGRPNRDSSKSKICTIQSIVQPCSS